MADLDAIFKAYDVRGVVPDQLDAAAAGLIGRAFAEEICRPDGATEAVVGHDMRQSSPSLAAAFAAGVRDAGVAVRWIGLASTDEVYFAAGHLDLPAAVVTASHNPSTYNGIKLCRAKAVPVGADSGLRAVQQRSREWSEQPPPSRSPRGRCVARDVLAAYADCLHALVPVKGRPLRVVADAGNGMAGLTAPAVFGPLDIDVLPLYFELDGSFPHHEPNPLHPANLRDLQAEVVRSGADVGLAFDGDADRCFAVDETGRPVSPAALGSLIAVRELDRRPGSHVVHNLIAGGAVRDAILAHGGVPVRTPVGHALIKRAMADTDAVFGAEHSGHFYFRDFWYADCGMLAALHLLAALAGQERSLSSLVADLDPYVASGEVNVSVDDNDRVLSLIERSFVGRSDVTIDRLDGLTVTAADWWLNLRPSNTEPMLRLNVEAESAPQMERMRDFVLTQVRRTT